jgi:hypothetical protein
VLAGIGFELMALRVGFIAGPEGLLLSRTLKELEIWAMSVYGIAFAVSQLS